MAITTCSYTWTHITTLKPTQVEEKLQVESYHRRLLFTEVFIDTFFGPYFHFCLELALETWAKALLTHSLWVHDPNHTHSLANFQSSGLFDQRTLHLTENCLQIQKWCPYKYWPRLFYIQPRQLPCAQHVMTIPPILAQNLQNRLHQLITCRRYQKASLVVKGLKGILTSYTNKLKKSFLISK